MAIEFVLSLFCLPYHRKNNNNTIFFSHVNCNFNNCDNVVVWLYYNIFTNALVHSCDDDQFTQSSMCLFSFIIFFFLLFVRSFVLSCKSAQYFKIAHSIIRSSVRLERYFRSLCSFSSMSVRILQ